MGRKPTYPEEFRRKVAEDLAATISDTKPKGDMYAVAHRHDIAPKTIYAWFKTKSFQAAFDDAKALRYAGVAEKGLGGVSVLDLMKGNRRAALERLADLISEANPIAAAKIFDSMDRGVRLEEGMPTGITEERLKRIAEYSGKTKEELLEIFEDKKKQIPAALQAVENPVALEETEH